MDLVEFLLARIAEDERTAAIAAAGPGCGFGDYELAVVINPPRGTVEASPTRILTECDAKRRIVEGELLREVGPVSHYIDPDVHANIRRRMVTPALRLLALPYADHPDCDEAWRP